MYFFVKVSIPNSYFYSEKDAVFLEILFFENHATKNILY